MKKIYRSHEHRMVSGVLGGLGEHYKIDPNILRILFLIFLLATGLFPGVIAYIIAVIILPEAAYITPSKPIIDDDDDTII